MRSLLIIFSFLVSTALIGQEIVTGLQFNEAIKQEHQRRQLEGSVLKSGAQSTAVTLPFFDDFASYSLYPKESLWIGNSVFINKDFPFYATNVGAATFDAIDETGSIYPDATWIPFEADVLTSQPIRLDSVFDPVIRKIGPEDSLYLSFYYQPQGVGDDPES